MSDIVPNGDDLAAAGAGGGIATVIASAIAFFARAQTATRLDLLSQQLADLTAKVTVLVAASERRDDQHDRLDAERRLARIEARLDGLERAERHP